MKALLGLYLAIPLSLLAINAQAAENADTVEQGSSWLYMEQGNGLITNLPAMENQELIESVKNLKQSLTDEKEQLATTVQEKKLKPKDAVITALVPGGLLYASYKMVKYRQARSNLAEVSSEIEELTVDMVRLTALEGDSRVAMLY